MHARRTNYKEASRASRRAAVDAPHTARSRPSTSPVDAPRRAPPHSTRIRARHRSLARSRGPSRARRLPSLDRLVDLIPTHSRHRVRVRAPTEREQRARDERVRRPPRLVSRAERHDAPRDAARRRASVRSSVRHRAPARARPQSATRDAIERARAGEKYRDVYVASRARARSRVHAMDERCGATARSNANAPPRARARVAERRDDTHMPPQSDDVSASMVIGYFYVMHA